MHLRRLIATLILVVLTLGTGDRLFSAGASYATPSDAIPSSLADPPTTFYRYVTITVDAGTEYAPSLSSYWATRIISLSVGTGGLVQLYTLPDDSTEITASVTGGTYEIAGTTITFTLNPGVGGYFWGYRTSEKVNRQGAQYRIDQVVNSNAYYRYIGNLFYSSPLQYAGSIGGEVITSTPGVLSWNELVPLNTANGFHRFEADAWLFDSRLPQPDLTVLTASMTTDMGPGVPHIHLTATIQNNGSIESGAPTYLQAYERVSPSVPPTSPIDLDGGLCRIDIIPQCPPLGALPNPIPFIPSETTLTLNGIFTPVRAGLLDIYLQVDSFGGPLGLTAESDETNNQIYVGSVRLERVYLPLVRK